MTQKTSKDFSTETLGGARIYFFKHLKTTNISNPTRHSYGRDFDVITEYFKAEKLVQKILPAHVGAFLKSDIFLKKKNGEIRAKPTADKIARVLRMFLTWAVETGRLEKLPIPQEARMGARSIKEQKERAAAKAAKTKAKPQTQDEPEPESNQELEPEEAVEQANEGNPEPATEETQELVATQA